MLSFEKNLDKEIRRLEEVLNHVLKVEKDLPEGSLNVSNGNLYRYWKGERTYISKGNKKLVHDLCLNSYIPKLKKNLKRRLSILKNYKKFIENNPLSSIEENFNKNQKQYLKPIYKKYDDLTIDWISEKYDKKTIASNPNMLITNRNDLVRSKSECLIANSLYERKIAYRYEAGIDLIDSNGSKRKVYPDFTILHPKTREIIIWEHFGMMDNSNYSKSALMKINSYINNGYIPGINLICTFESLDVNLNGASIKIIIDKLFC